MRNIKYYFIFNPVAGDGKMLSEIIKSAERVCEDKQLDYEVYLTKKRGDATKFVKTHLEMFQNVTCRFYACGGDGTISEVINGMIGYDNAEFGVIPVGTGNDFVRNFADERCFLDIETQLNARPIYIDALKCNDRYCVNMINIGFDCEVAKRVNVMRNNSVLPQKMAYIAGLVQQFGKMSGANPRIRIDGKSLGTKKLLLTAIANGSFCGGGFNSSPKAHLDDGLIDVGFVKMVSRAKFLSLVGPYKNGTLENNEGAKDCYEHYKCENIVLDFDVPQSVCLDGEIENYRRIDISIAHKALKFALPRGIRFKCSNCRARADKIAEEQQTSQEKQQ